MSTTSTFTVRESTVEEFLAGHRFAVVGASDTPDNFGRTVYCELKKHGYDVVAVHQSDSVVDGDPAYADLASVPGDLDGVIVMVGADKALDLIRAVKERCVDKVWLFRGLGGDGAASEESVRLCHELGLTVVAGACPLMFLQPVGWFHRLHRSARRHRHGLVADAE